MNKDDDESLDDVNSLIRKIKGTKNDEEAQKSKETADKSRTASAGEPASDIGDFTALKKKMSMPDVEKLQPLHRHLLMIWCFLMLVVNRKKPINPHKRYNLLNLIRKSEEKTHGNPLEKFWPAG